MLKVNPHPDYPTEEGRYLRGNDFSPVAVAIILNCDEDKIPPELEILIRAGIETGAAISGSVQTENIGFEKIICNIIANPNIRYLVVGGPESEGHLTGEAMTALIDQGVDEKKRIIGTDAPHPFLFNLSMEMIERFRQQLSLINIQFDQENPVEFRDYSLYDPGAFPETPLSGKITWRITQPWAEVMDENERDAKKKALELMERLRARAKDK
jgi:tetrahydromethanopterin S-methyltransferase subunit A